MCRLNAMIVVALCVPFCAIKASNADAMSTNEETTDTMMIDVYVPSSDETFDPQKDYADFKTSYEKLYRISGSPYESPPSMQHQQQNAKSMHDSQVAATSVVDDMDTEADDTTSSSDIGSDASDMQTTIPPPIEQQTTIQLMTENVGVRSMNEILKSTQRPLAYASFKQLAPNAEFVKQKPSSTFDHMNTNADNSDNDNEDTTNEMGEPIEQDTVDNLPNDVTVRNESSDYMNDEAAAAAAIAAADVNYTQSITVRSYPMETTMAAMLPTPPIFVSTRTPTNTLLVNTPASVTLAAAPTVAAPTTVTEEITPNQSSGKKSKKIEALSPRIYKYSAEEIVRKYLDDSYLRAPLATLINTAPEPLRKTKLLWKSALRPNTPINIVLVAFNSSGKLKVSKYERNRVFQLPINHLRSIMFHNVFGIGVGVTYSFKNTRTMIAGLESVQESREMLGGGSGFYGILRASELIPYDSAIFISTDQIPEDIGLMKNAATILLKKRIRVNTSECCSISVAFFNSNCFLFACDSCI